MDKKSISVLKLNSKESKEFFLQDNIYSRFNLPEYFNFRDLLYKLFNEVKKKDIKQEFLSFPNSCEGVNFKLLYNKDGKNSFRERELVHPLIYVSLVKLLTEEENWQHVVERFKLFRSSSKVESLFIPSIKKGKENSDSSLVNWFSRIEQDSIRMSMDYDYVFSTDIQDCYNSIHNHCLVDVMHERGSYEKTEISSLLGKKIQEHIQYARYQRTNGIPKGGMLFDFIVELVLSYVDYLLTQKIDNSVKDYHILRYGDDYRIFVNNPSDGDYIFGCLSEVLIVLGMKLSPYKTCFSTSVIQGSVNKDKIEWFYKQKNCDIEKQLLVLHDLSLQNSNSVTLKYAYMEIYYQIKNYESEYKDEEIKVWLSILTDISKNSPKTYLIYVCILSLLLLNISDKSSIPIMLNKVFDKMSKVKNAHLILLWLQRLAQSYGIKLGESYHPLYNLVLTTQTGDSLWNSEWIKSEHIKNIIENTKIIDKDKIKGLTTSIDIAEITSTKSK